MAAQARAIIDCLKSAGLYTDLINKQHMARGAYNKPSNRSDEKKKYPYPFPTLITRPWKTLLDKHKKKE